MPAKKFLQKFLQTLKHSDLPKGWQDNPEIVEEAGRLYREMGTESPFFKAWGGSPEKQYHGTTKDFDTFKSEGVQGGYHSRLPNTFFTTDNPEVAASYVRKPAYFDWEKDLYDNGASVMPLYVNAEKPLRVNAKGNYWNEIPYKGDFVQTNNIADMVANKEGGKLSAIIKNVIDEGKGKVSGKPSKSTVTITGDPTQIKSVFNRGTFDPDDPNILRQLMPWIAGGTVAGTALAAPEDAEAARLKYMQSPQFKAGEQAQALQDPVWSPADLITAPVGAGVTLGKAGLKAALAAMGLDPVVALGMDKATEGISAALDYMNKRPQYMQGAWF